MRRFPQLGVNVRRALGFTTIAFLLAATTNTAQSIPFEPSDEGQLFGVRRELPTAGIPSGVAFVNGMLYVANIDTGTVIAFRADGTETTLLAAATADESSPLFGLIPNMLSSATVRIDDGTPADTTALLVSDSSQSRVFVLSLEAGQEGEHLFTMWLGWPDGHEDEGSSVAVINGMAIAPDARFVFVPAANSLTLEDLRTPARPAGTALFGAGWTFDFGQLHPAALLAYTAATEFHYEAGAAQFAPMPFMAMTSDDTKEVFGVTFDSLGNLYAVDTVMERLRVYAPDLSPLFTFAPDAGTTGEFHEPYGMAYWPDADGGPGRLFVADALNNRILAYRPNLDASTLDHIFTIEGFTIDQFDSALPYAMTVDPATGRIATSDSSGLANRTWLLQTRNLAAFDFEVLDATNIPIETVCSGDPYQVRFSLTVPDGWPPLTNVVPELTIAGDLEAAQTGQVDLAAGQAFRYTYALTAPGDDADPFVGNLALVAGGTASEITLETTEVLTRRGFVAVSNCAVTNATPTITAASVARQVSGWIPAFSHPAFTVTLTAVDDTEVNEIEYEVFGANDLGFNEIRVPNPVPGAPTQVLTVSLPEFGESTIRFRARDNNLEWSDMQALDLNLVFVETRRDVEGEVIPPFTAGPPPTSGIIYSATGMPPGISFNPATAEFSGTLASNAAGDHMVVVTESLATPASVSSFNFIWTVSDINFPPVAIDDRRSTNEDTPLLVLAPGVLANDTDPDLTPLSGVLFAQPLHGTLAFNANGSFVYTPPHNFHGSDFFLYKASDGLDSSLPATVSITVTAVNDPPSFIVGAAQQVAEDAGAQSVINWATAINAGPADEAAQTVMFLVVSNTNPALFSVPPAVSPTGTLTYQLAPNASGSALVSLQLKDSGGVADQGDDTSDPQTFTITVAAINDPPVANDDSYSATAGIGLTVAAPGVLGNDQDIDGPPLTASVVSGPSTGTLQLNANGSFTYTAPASFTGTVTFTYRASDGASASQATVTIGVAPGNVPPICTAASTNANLWPANHKEVYVTVGGVVDPEGRPVGITFTSIVQDEPTNSVGQGNTMQDGAITNGGARAWVRAERAGSHKVPGDGRVYLIGFLATDAGGLTCAGTVRVDVPHDQRGRPAGLSPGRWNSITGQELP